MQSPVATSASGAEGDRPVFASAVVTPNGEKWWKTDICLLRSVMRSISLLVETALAASAIVANPHVANADRRLEAYREGQCGGTPSGWQKQGSEFGELMTVNLLEVRKDQLVWNHKPVNKRIIRRYIAEMSRLNPLPNIVLVIDPRSSCSEVRAIRAIITSRLHCGSVRARLESHA